MRALADQKLAVLFVRTVDVSDQPLFEEVQGVFHGTLGLLFVFLQEFIDFVYHFLVLRLVCLEIRITVFALKYGLKIAIARGEWRGGGLSGILIAKAPPIPK